MSAITNSQWSIKDDAVLPFEEFDFAVHGYAHGFEFYHLKFESPYTNWWYLYAYDEAYNWSESLLYSYRDSFSVENFGKWIVLIDGDDINNPAFEAMWRSIAEQTSGLIYKAWKYEIDATANAIRSKGGTSSSIEWSADYPYGFASAVSNIYLGNDTRNTTAFPSDVAIGQTAASSGVFITGIMPNARGVNF